MLGRGVGQTGVGLGSCDLFDRVLELMQGGAANIDCDIGRINKACAANSYAIGHIWVCVVIRKQARAELTVQRLTDLAYGCGFFCGCWVKLDWRSHAFGG